MLSAATVVAFLPLSCAQQGGGFEIFAPDRALARAADADRSGDVSAEEWSSFLATLAPAPDGSLEAGSVLAQLFAPALDADEDGRFTRADVRERLSLLDADESGSLERAELFAVITDFRRGRGSRGEAQGSGTPGNGGAGATDAPRGARLIDGLVAFGADEDGNLALEPAEWNAAVADGAGPVPPETLARWIANAERYVPEDRNAFAPSTLCLTLRSGLDATADGRLTTEDLQQLFAGLDTDASGSLSPDELARTETSGARSGAAISAAEEAPAPDPARPPLVPWQRSLADALALSRSSGKPLLLCVNMDDESASDQLALRRYRDPEFVELMRGFVPLLASPDRHRPRDRDDRNRRLADPRFGRLLAEEYIAIEPELYERYFNGQRVAPRHVGVAPDGAILFDLYLLQDLSAIDRALRQHGRPDASWPAAAELDVQALLASPDAAARELVEQSFARGDEPTRQRLLAGALSSRRGTQHPELARMALRDPSPYVRRRALELLAAYPLEIPLEVFPEGLRVAAEVPGATEALAGALERRAGSTTGPEPARARRLARIARAGAAPPTTLDVELWRTLLRGAAPAFEASDEKAEGRDVFAQLAALEARMSAGEAGLGTVHARLALDAAERLIAQGGGNPSFLLQDALDAARKAVESDASDALAWAILASSAYQLSDFTTAGDAAVRALPGLLGWAETKRTADVLEVLAESRMRALYEALADEQDWPDAWLAELLAAHEVLLAHPHGTEAQALAGLDALTSLELFAQQAGFLRRALARWPLSGVLHNYFRWQVLRDGGAEALLEAYDGLELGPEHGAAKRWFAGVAALVAAERLVEDGYVEAALAAYDRAGTELRASFEQEPGFQETARFYLAVGEHGRARVQLDRGELDLALAAIRASAAEHPEPIPAPDGLGHTRAETARLISQALERAGREAEARELDPLAAESQAAAPADEAGGA